MTQPLSEELLASLGRLGPLLIMSNHFNLNFHLGRSS